MEMFPKVQSVLKISTVATPILWGRLRSRGAGVSHFSTHCLNGLMEVPAPYFSSHWENWTLGFLFPVARCQKHLFSNLDLG